MRYSIQMGAFLNLDNAILLTQSLERQGLDAYYFRHNTGAEGLSTDGIIKAYYIVSPDDYALAKARRHGSKELREEIVQTAESFLGLPYRWGGSSADKGFDCSGLAMAVYQLNGLNLPRSSREQYRVGRAVKRSELAEADLVFFATSGGKRVSHVGVYTGDGRFIHAPRRGKTIRVGRLSNTYYQTRYVGARSYLR
jgi:cell wall-associated NlpC family hydrolase